MKREITIDGRTSDWFEKAVFTLKDEQLTPVPKDLFSYAEELVEKHLKRYPSRDKKNTLFMKQDEETQKLVQAMTKAYDLQNHYNVLKKQESRLKEREKQIHLFFILSVTVCIISILALFFTSIYG